MTMMDFIALSFELFWRNIYIHLPIYIIHMHTHTQTTNITTANPTQPNPTTGFTHQVQVPCINENPTLVDVYAPYDVIPSEGAFTQYWLWIEFCRSHI